MKQMQDQIESVTLENAKTQADLAASRDQNKKLVLLLKKMEEKLKESERQAEELDT